jgi:hypothetical protein
MPIVLVVVLVLVFFIGPDNPAMLQFFDYEHEHEDE